MTTARSLLVDPESPGFFQRISRCVRRAWLCGADPYNGKSYEHRWDWVEVRLLELAGIFAVGVTCPKISFPVIPAKAGIQFHFGNQELDPSLRWDGGIERLVP